MNAYIDAIDITEKTIELNYEDGSVEYADGDDYEDILENIKEISDESMLPWTSAEKFQNDLQDPKLKARQVVELEEGKERLCLYQNINLF